MSNAPIKRETNEPVSEKDDNNTDDLGSMLEALSLGESSRTCICTDEAMMLHKNLTDP